MKIVVSLELDVVSDEKEIDSSITNCNIGNIYGDPEILDTAGERGFKISLKMQSLMQN